MNSFSETLNQWGGGFLNFAGTMLLQSSLLIVILFAADFLCRRKIRASIRYALWLVLLLKLILPPALALPTSPAWWLRATPATIQIQPQFADYTVTYDSQPLPKIPPSWLAVAPPKPKLTLAAWLFLISISVSVILFVWLLLRWRQVARQVRRAAVSERLTILADETRSLAGIKFKLNPRVRLTADTMSPAVCGLFRPVILIPRSLAEHFSDEQLRAVLLHELIHLRRRDVWVNFAQSLLQIIYWWQPLLWLANAWIRRAREEAVDDAVMLALRDAAETYAPTLLEVARLALHRPLNSLGLVGILESRSALRQRIERLINFNAPKKAGLTLVSALGILAFTAVAVPMGGGPNADEQSVRQRQPPNQIALEPRTNSAVLGRRAIADMIHRVRLQKVEYDAVPLAVALDDLAENIAKHNPGRLTVPFENSPDLNSVTITINPPITDVSVEDVLDAIVLVANRPIKYSIEEQGIEFSWKDQKSPTLYTRAFKVDAQAFINGVKGIVDFNDNMAFNGKMNYPAESSAAVRKFFSALGVDLTSPAGKSVFLNERTGVLLVRATESDLDTIQKSIAPGLRGEDAPTPQVHIKARFLEAPKGTLDGLKKIMVIPNQTKQPAGLVGILTSKNFKTAWRILEARKNVEVLAEPEVVTTTGRQTQMRATEVITTVITNFALLENATNGRSSVVPQMSKVETGPVLDAVPCVLSDGYTINLTAIASLTKFLGYERTTNTAAAYTSSGEKVDLPTIKPRFQVQQAVEHLNLWDNQTLVMKGSIQPQTQSLNKKYPDVPLLGQRYQSQTETKKELIVFVTATIVDPEGNRVHSDGDLPFTQNGIPSQPPQLNQPRMDTDERR